MILRVISLRSNFAHKKIAFNINGNTLNSSLLKIITVKFYAKIGNGFAFTIITTILLPWLMLSHLQLGIVQLLDISHVARPVAFIGDCLCSRLTRPVAVIGDHISSRLSSETRI